MIACHMSKTKPWSTSGQNMREASGAPERCQGVSRYMPQVVPYEQAPPRWRNCNRKTLTTTIPVTNVALTLRVSYSVGKLRKYSEIHVIYLVFVNRVYQAHDTWLHTLISQFPNLVSYCSNVVFDKIISGLQKVGNLPACWETGHSIHTLQKHVIFASVVMEVSQNGNLTNHKRQLEWRAIIWLYHIWNKC